MTMGDRVHFLRTKLGLTLQELGDKVGVGASTVRKWETGYIKTLRTDKMQKLAAALETSVDYLMGWTDSNLPTSGEIHTEQERTKEEAELLRIFNTLSVKDRSKLMNYAWSLEEESDE